MSGNHGDREIITVIGGEKVFFLGVSLAAWRVDEVYSRCVDFPVTLILCLAVSGDMEQP